MIYTMNGMATQLISRPISRALSAAYPAISAAMVSRTCTSRASRFGRGIRRLGRRRASRGRTLDARRYRRTCEAEHAMCNPSPIRRSIPDLFHAVVSQAIPPGQGPHGGQPTPMCRRGRRIDMLGKLTWDAIPFDQPIP